MAATAAFGLLRRQLLLLAGSATAVLLVCDAWFDLTTVQPAERWPRGFVSLTTISSRNE